LAEFLEKAAGLVNSWYHAGNPTRNPELAVLVENPELRAARLVLTRAARLTLRNGLRILGIEAPERMERATVAEGDFGPSEASDASAPQGGV
jgi:arginyl-tRNA synthetase